MEKEIKTIVEQNIAIHGNVISYAYEVEPLASLNTTLGALQTLSNIEREFFKELNMQLQIAILPRKPKQADLQEFYQSEKDKRAFEELLDERATLEQGMIRKAVNNSFNYDIFLFVVENRPKFKSVNVMSNFLDKYTGTFTEKQSRKLFKNAQITEESVQAVVNKHLSYTVVAENKLIQVMKKLEFYYPEEEVLSIHDQPLELAIKYNFEYLDTRTEKLVQQEQYEEFLGIEKFPDTNKANNFLSVIQNTNLPLTTIYKIDFRNPDEMYKEMLGKKSQIEKDAKKFKREYKRNSAEYQRALNAAHEGAKEFELTDEAAVRLQAFYRLHATTEEELVSYREKLLRYCKKAKLKINYYGGRQERLRQNMMPYNNLVKKHHLTNLKFLADLNVFGGSKLGDKIGHPFFKNVRTGATVFLDYIKLMSGRTANTEAITMMYGSSGSGKSMLNFFMIMQMLIFSGMSVLKINPKNDEQNIGANLKWLMPFYQNICLGSDSNHKGALDPFLLYKDNIKEAISVAKNDILLLMNALKYQEIDLYAIDMAVDKMIEKGTKLNMTNLCHELMRDDKVAFIGKNILSMSKMTLGELFLGDDDSNFHFDYGKLFTVLTFDNLPVISAYNPHNLEHVFTNLLLGKTTTIVQNYINYWERPANIVIDEYFVWSRYPIGKQAVAVFGRMIRAKQKHMFVLTQNPSDVDEESGLLNNTAVTFIGKLSSPEEVEIATKRYNLGKSLKDFLLKKQAASETKEGKKVDYDFILIDYNNRKAPVQGIIPSQDIFNDYNNHYQESEAIQNVREKTVQIPVEKDRSSMYGIVSDISQ